MRQCLICCIAVLLGLTLSPASAVADDPAESVHISGAGISPSDWSVAQLQKQFVGEISAIDSTSHGQKHVYHCIALVSLLKAAGVPVEFKMNPKADPKLKSHPLRFVVGARGRDGYVVAFSVAELLPEIGNRHVWVAIDEDGQPIPDQEGPIRLLSPDDQLPARSVHQLAEISLLDVSATTRPDSAP